MNEWKELIEQNLQKQKNSVAKINIDKATVQYSEKIKLNRVLKSLIGVEETEGQLFSLAQTEEKDFEIKERIEKFMDDLNESNKKEFKEIIKLIEKSAKR